MNEPFKHAKQEHYCCVCGARIVQGKYCIQDQAAYQHDHYFASPARYKKLKQAVKKQTQILQIAPALGWTINEAKIKEKIAKLQQKIAEMEKLNPALKKEN